MTNDLTCTIKDAADYLRNAGLRIPERTIWRWLENGICDFGYYLPPETENGKPDAKCYKAKVMEWAADKSPIAKRDYEIYFMRGVLPDEFKQS